MFVIRLRGPRETDLDACLPRWRAEARRCGLIETAVLPAVGAVVACFAPDCAPLPPVGRGRVEGDGRLWLFDGCLRQRDLLRAAVSPDRSPDDDLSLYVAAERRWAAEAPQHLHGDFAALAWNPAAGTLYACTDHAGGRRLYFAAMSDGGFALATHLPLLLATPELDRRLDGRALGLVPLALITATDTPFRAVEMLPGGHRLHWRPGASPRRHRWWRPAGPEPARRRLSAEAAAETITPLVKTAVAEHLDADGPVAAMLSGGLDSSLVAAHAARRLLADGRALHAYTAVPQPGLPVPTRAGWDASEWPLTAQLAARHPNIRHVAVHAGEPCLLDSFAAWHQTGASPVRNSANCQWMDAMAADARAHGCRTLLGGNKGNASISLDGGAAALNALLVAGDFRELWRTLQRDPASLPRQLVRMVRAAHRAGRRADNRAMLDYAPIPPTAIADALHAARRRAVEPVRWDYHEARVRMLQLGTVLMPDLRARHGIELRDPTADRRLVEALLQLPLTATVHDGYPRALARLAGAGVVPDEIRWRTRRGQQAPEQAGYFSQHADRYRDALRTVMATPLRDWYAPAALSERLDTLIAGRATAERAAFMHRVLDVGLFLDHAARRWGASVDLSDDRPSRGPISSSG